jgi:tetratricopeptide (TPR) repeat protein
VTRTFAKGDLAGATVAVIGRLGALPRWRIVAELGRRKAVLTQRLGKAQGLLIGWGAHLRVAAVSAAIAEAEQRGLWLASERMLLRALGLVEPRVPPEQPLDRVTLARLGRLEPETIRLLALFDVLDEQAGSFDFRDLVAVRQVRSLLDAGASLADIIGALVTMRRQGPGDSRLAHARITRLADGALALSVGEHLAELNGQLRLRLDDGGNPSLEALFEEATLAEEERRWVDAERLYRRVLAIAPRDAVAAFNLANVLVAQGEAEEATAYLSRAVAFDPGFAEAWYNLAHRFEAEGDVEAARLALERSVAADAKFADAVYNLARLWFAADRPDLAAPLYERYLALDPASSWSEKARKALALCGMMQREPPCGGASRE